MLKPLAALLVLTGWLTFSANAPAAAEDGWQFQQQFKGFSWGDKAATVDLGKENYRLTWKPSRATLLMKAPDWQVRTFNSSHTDYTNFESFEKMVKGKSVDRYLKGQSFTKSKTGIIAGIKATEYVLGTGSGGTEEASDYSTSVWLADDIAIQPKLSRLFSMIYGTPDLKRFPLSMEIQTFDGTVLKQFKTVSAKRANLPPNTFRLPRKLSPGKVYQPTLFFEPDPPQQPRH